MAENSAVENLLAQVFAGVVGGVPADEYDRAEINSDRAEYWAENPEAGPALEYDNHQVASSHGKWDIWTSTYRYDFNPRAPWFAEQVLEAFVRRFTANARAGAFESFRVTVRYYLEADTGPGFAPYPTGGAFDRIRGEAQRFAYRKSGAVRIQPSDESTWQWGALRDALANEDKYDERDGIAEEFGNRMSRVVFKVIEYRHPTGGAIADAFNAPPRSVAELPDVGDELCGQACLVYAMTKPGSDVRKKLKAGGRATLRNKAGALAEMIGVPGRMALGDFNAFVRAFPHFSVTVMSDKTTVEFTAVGGPMTQTIYLLLHMEHYYVINNITSFAMPSRTDRAADWAWCRTCCKAMRKTAFKHHACSGHCTHCGHEFATLADRDAHYAQPLDNARCETCNHGIRYEECRAFHECESWLCLSCMRSYPLGRKAGHVCGETWCKSCKVYSPPPRDGSAERSHRCYVAKVAKGKPAEELWAYDIESTLDPDADGRVVHHIALVVVRHIYSAETHAFRGEAAFLDWVEARRKKTTLIAHNGSGYDAYLVNAAILARGRGAPEQIVLAGQKVMMMRYRQCLFIDSMRHIAGSLSRLAKTFGLAETKGFFPYRFFTRANLAYCGQVPGAEWFDPDRMPAARRAEFFAWHADRGAQAAAGDQYSLWDEAVKYCKLDVELLARAMRRYRDAGLEAVGVDPLRSATIAGYALKVYRSSFMPEDSIPILDRAEYDFVRRGFFGGRTDARQMLRTVTPEQLAAGHRIVYLDIVSLYPTVQRHDQLPAGSPWWLADADLAGLATTEACAAWLAELEAARRVAMVECAVECPDDLYHPVLLARKDERLTASLDITGGTWSSIELSEALRRGYRVPRIHRALVSETRGDLFADYVDQYMALKGKHAPSGAEPNKGMYALAKMMLNSLWGKLGQRDRNSEMRFFDGERALADWRQATADFNSGRLEGLDVIESTPAYLFARLEKPDGENLHLRTTDLLLAAFVTARARLRLYEMLAAQGERVLYHDTDSVILALGPEDPTPPTGVSLGEWTDETLLPDGTPDPIVEFVGLGPKTYAYRTASGAACVKSKGFSTGFTLEQYRGLAEDFLAGKPMTPLEQESLQFRRQDRQMVTVEGFTKKLTATMQKLAVVSATRTLPYGHRELAQEG